METQELKQLFFSLFNSKNEDEVNCIIKVNPEVFRQENWHPFGENESFFGVIENQQASPVPALIEKITNSIDAILTRKCYEAGIEPTSVDAPKSMDEALEKFFPDSKQWDLPSFRKVQSESIQIIADGPRMDTSLIIYDDGEGQHPENFEKTFLSLLRGNKNEIHFVQGKYNMGGSGAIVFCGKKRYHLIASKRFDGKGKFGFTLIRQHPFTHEEEGKKKNTWYEFFKINGEIPSFEIDQLDLGLHNRKFTTGTILKLYSYDLPAGSRSVISRDLNQSINEYLFEPALPLCTIDKKERYPDDRNLERDLYGLKRRLEEDKGKYIDDHFLETYDDKELGKLKITAYVFKPKLDGKTSKESRDSISREFFKNNMSVLFSLNGQVHGHLTSEFITRTLKMQLIKDHLLIHVDCTNLNYSFRKELFMASRDRLKHGDETAQLRETIAKVLLKSKLVDIYKRRKDSISFAGEDKNELLRSFTKNLPLKSELLKLLNQTFKLEDKGEKPEKEKKEKKEKEHEEEFKPQRFPSFFKYGKDGGDTKPILKVPLGGEKSIKFNTDVENEYFVRVEEPGELKVGLLNHSTNETEGGTKSGTPKKIEDLFYVQKSNPQDGTIKVVLAPTGEVKVGDTIEVKASLTNPGQDYDQIFLIKISEREKPKEKTKEKEDDNESKIGLPDLILVYKESKEGEERKTWAELDEAGVTMSFETIVHPFAEADVLQAIYVNMDSTVLKSYKTTLKSLEQFEAAEKRYYTSVYFHTLFLFTISKNKKYSMKQMQGEQEVEKDLVEYVKDIFESYYAQFLLNFGMSELVQSLES
ncbi:MAG TPA: hypothetical protein PL018_07190 [Ignavibacteriaceae bacterium]|nr:hypothetical protein [Ignavibacteriaceae bacterium]